MKILIRIIVIILFLATAKISGQDCKIKIEITGYSELSGYISIGLFNDPENFPKKNENNLGARIKIVDSLVTYTFTNLNPGDYAIAVYHDQNANGKMDSNFLGIPTEDYVFSNYATGTFGPPSFEDSKIILTDSLFIKLDMNK